MITRIAIRIAGVATVALAAYLAHAGRIPQAVAAGVVGVALIIGPLTGRRPNP